MQHIWSIGLTKYGLTNTNKKAQRFAAGSRSEDRETPGRRGLFIARNDGPAPAFNERRHGVGDELRGDYP